MTSTRFDLIVSDFDGTLVRSAEAKRQAFFDIFPADCAEAVAMVLAGDPDGSRHRVIPAMIAQAAADGHDVTGLAADELVARYGQRAAQLVDSAPPVAMAFEVLADLARTVPVYLFSATPHDELIRQVEKRAWTSLFAAIYGYPARKPDVLALLLSLHDCPPERLLVVGDGVSDADAAQANGCHFLDATEDWPRKLNAMMVARND